eukprot:14036288-Alexandrium_andersonii.AAC.1
MRHRHGANVRSSWRTSWLKCCRTRVVNFEPQSRRGTTNMNSHMVTSGWFEKALWDVWCKG